MTWRALVQSGRLPQGAWAWWQWESPPESTSQSIPQKEPKYTRRAVWQTGMSALLAGVLVLGTFGSVPAQVQPPAGTIPLPVVTATVATTLQGTQLHLHNFGPKHDHSWH